MSRLPSVHAQQAGSRPGGLTGHDLMSMFPPSQSTPLHSSSPFGREEREYLSSRRDEHARLRARVSRSTTTTDDSSSTGSGSGSESASHTSSGTSNQRTLHPQTAKSNLSSSTTPAPKRMPTNYQTQVHLDQGSGDSQFLVLRMPLASMSNTDTSDCHFSEFRATQYPSRGGKSKRP